jgi:hypothetical protein
MNKSLETLLDRVSTWPEEAQAELLQHLIRIEAKYCGVYRLSEEERGAVRRGLAEMLEGKFATDEQVAAVFDRWGS